ncbi:MAG: hypothetical protein ACJ77K_14105 [Bacteroidia bacterium]|jgi:hypothetical protein
MKKLLRSFAVVVAVIASAAASYAQPTNPKALEGRARGAAEECLQPYRGSLYEISASTDVTGICFVEGFTYRVSFYAGPNCNGPGPCPAFPTVLVATVDFGCEGEILNVTCH